MCVVERCIWTSNIVCDARGMVPGVNYIHIHLFTNSMGLLSSTGKVPAECALYM